MNLFRVEADKERGQAEGTKTWLIEAHSLFEAMSLVPDAYAVKSVKVQLGPASGSGPGRVIGWVGPSALS
jgi:hypothetical protein